LLCENLALTLRNTQGLEQQGLTCENHAIASAKPVVLLSLLMWNHSFGRRRGRRLLRARLEGAKAADPLDGIRFEDLLPPFDRFGRLAIGLASRCGGWVESSTVSPRQLRGGRAARAPRGAMAEVDYSEMDSRAARAPRGGNRFIRLCISYRFRGELRRDGGGRRWGVGLSALGVWHGPLPIALSDLCVLCG